MLDRLREFIENWEHVEELEMIDMCALIITLLELVVLEDFG